MTGRLETVDDRPAIRLERRLDHPVARVWRAITEPGELERWFVAAVDWKPEAGEVFEAHGQTGRITELEPPRAIAWIWEDELFRFDLEPSGDGCLLVFTHVFNDRALGAQHAAGWEPYLHRLDVHLGGGHLSAEEAHATRTIAPEQVTLEDGPRLRLERRYDHRVERVWRALTDPDELDNWFPPGEDLQVTESQPPRLLAGSWYGDELRFELTPDGDACVLVFTHAFADRAKAARDAAGWDRCFARFEALLRGAPMSEAESLARWPDVHERYAADFGVDPELGRKAIAEYGG
jgi:uncharacterized protein YndB with AHSA1/START domain